MNFRAARAAAVTPALLSACDVLGEAQRVTNKASLSLAGFNELRLPGLSHHQSRHDCIRMTTQQLLLASSAPHPASQYHKRERKQGREADQQGNSLSSDPVLLALR